MPSVLFPLSGLLACGVSLRVLLPLLALRLALVHLLPNLEMLQLSVLGANSSAGPWSQCCSPLPANPHKKHLLVLVMD